MRKSKAGLLELAAALNNISTEDEKAHVRVSISSVNGKYQFRFFDHDIEPPKTKSYDIDIDLIPSSKVKADVISQDTDGFCFQVVSDGVHFRPIPVDCSIESITAAITITFFE